MGQSSMATLHQADFPLQGWLRELVWREKDTPRLRKSMIKALPEFRELLAKESVFCFDAAAKLLVWTDLVYTVEDKAEARAAECAFALPFPHFRSLILQQPGALH